MIVAYWILGGITSVLFLISGVTKAVWSRARLQETGLAWAGEFSTTSIKLFATAEILGATGVIVPVLAHSGRSPVLGPIAAMGLGFLMVGAAAVHIRRHETPTAQIFLIPLTAAVATIGFILFA